MRAIAVVLHRYVGLVLALFLVLTGLTGAVVAWYYELDAALNPGLFRVASPAPGANRLSPLALRERVEAQLPGTRTQLAPLELRMHEGRAAIFYLRGGTDFDQVFVDPYSGGVIGKRKWGDITQGPVNLMPFLLRLHYSLALGVVGTTLFGIVALVWTIDCFVGLAISFPSRRRWMRSFAVRWKAGGFRLNFDLHRAGALWMWAILLVLAWSSVAFNLGTVYDPLMRGLFEMQASPREGLPQPGAGEPAPPMGWEAGVARARAHFASLEQEKSMRLIALDSISYDPRRVVFRVRAKTDRDIRERVGSTVIFFSARDGELLGTHIPTGEAAGDTITSWLLTLHRADIWGAPYRIFMTLLGLLICGLSVTGVLIWWRKREARLTQRAR